MHYYYYYYYQLIVYKCSAVHTNLCLIQYRRPRRRMDS